VGLPDLPSLLLSKSVISGEDPLAGLLRPTPQPVQQALIDLASATLSDYVRHVY
jgi:hypothetical protein